MATNTPPTSFAHRLGQAVAMAWCWMIGRERRLVRLAGGMGVPAGVTHVGICLVALGIAIAVGYLLFLILALFVFAVLAAKVALHVGPSLSDAWQPEETQWRQGHSGYGVYRGDVRVDAGDFDEE